MRFAAFALFLAACAGAAPAKEARPAALPATPPAPTSLSAARAARQASDAELFDAANAALAGRDAARARDALIELLERWPTSSFRPFAWVTLGDLAFAQPDAAHQEEAERDYREATTTAPPENRVYGYAFYKLAYVVWNRGDGVEALACFAKAIDFGASYPSIAGAATLRDAALRDVILAFAQVGSPSRAYAFFLRLSGDKPRARAMLRELEQDYAGAGKPAEAHAARESEAYASGRIK